MAPKYTDRILHPFIHHNKILKAIWVPEIDRNFVPQGLAEAEGAILLAGYHHLENSPEFVTVFKIDSNSGAIEGKFSLPSYIHHGDGLAYSGKSIFWLTDQTGNILKIDAKKAFQKGTSSGAILGRFIDPKKRTHFCTYDGQYIWIGEWTEKRTPFIYKIDQNKALLAGILKDEFILDRVKIAQKSQGAAFDGEFLWLSQGARALGRLQKIDQRQKGRVLKTIFLPPGAEDIGFATEKTLWISFEAGAIKYRNWDAYFPLLIQLNLKSSDN